MSMPDAAEEVPASRYSVEERIGVLEELLSERYSCRAFLPQPVPRATIERILTAAQKTASWCNSQPWQLAIASGAATKKFRDAMYGAASSGKSNTGDFPFPREYRGVYLERRRESGFQLYNSLGIARGDKAAYAKQSLENFNLFGAPHVAIIHTDEALGVRREWPRCRRRRWRFIPRWCASISVSAMTGGWYAAFHSDSPTAATRPTAIAPRAPALRIPSRSSTNSAARKPRLLTAIRVSIVGSWRPISRRRRRRR